MREIKFRGYHNFEGNVLYPPDKRWIYGYYYFQESKHFIKDINDWKRAYVVEKGSVGEYTGLKDKNGEEGYFDDLVQWGKGLYQVIWNNAKGIAELIKCGGIESWATLEIQEIENGIIVGNIYENPELLDGKS